jgi:conjugal transfer pilus assembly protein TraV
MTIISLIHRANVAALLSVLLSSCAITGLDGTSNYGCKAPEGVKCDSVSGTYHNAVQNNLPVQRRSSLGSTPTAVPALDAVPRSSPVMLSTAVRSKSDEPTTYSATPLRAAPKVLRLWIKSWEDTDRDLNGESLVYVQIDGGRWLVDHVQRQSREAFAPVRPPKSASPPKLSQSDANKPAPAGPADDASAITQAVRSLQRRPTATAEN